MRLGNRLAAADAGPDRAWLSRIKLPELGPICEALGCSAEDLLGDAGLAAAATRNHGRLYGSLPIYTNTP